MTTRIWTAASVFVLLIGVLTGSTPADSATTQATQSSAAPSAAGHPMPDTMSGHAKHQMPASAPAAPDARSPSLEGVAQVVTGLKVADYLQPSWGNGAIPGLNDGGADGAFRFLCAPSHNSYDDPIIYPGQPGKSHLHTWFGNTKGNAHSTYASLRTTGESTCNNLMNRSAYWVPAMMHPSGKVVMPGQIGIYYKRPPRNSPLCREPYAKACIGLPRGLRYVFGYDMFNRKKSDPARFRWFNCAGDGAVSGHFATIKEAAKGCPTGAALGMLLVSPNCWNGKDLDSPDHRSHMAYQYYDGGHGAPVCPKTHPYLLPFFEVAPWYRNDGTASEWKLASDIQMGTEAGVTAHADWFGAWEDDIADIWLAHCIDKALNCSGGDLGNGKQIKTTAGYDYPTAVNLVAPPPRPHPQ